MNLVWVQSPLIRYKVAMCGYCQTPLLRLKHDQTNRYSYLCTLCERLTPQPTEHELTEPFVAYPVPIPNMG